MKKPFFSVVMPTRNRSNLLPFSIQSVLQQTFYDFELIISDNYSSDETSQVAQSFNDKRIKYFRSEKPLSLGESLEFALSHATGEFVTFLSDDDAYAKIFLERLESVLKAEDADVVSCRLAYYYANSVNEYGQAIPKESLVIRSFDREVSVLNSFEAVSALFATGGLSDAAPQFGKIGFPVLVNSAFRAAMIEMVKKRVKKLFPIIASDIYSSALFLNASKKYCFLDEPLYLHQIWEEGITSSGLANFQKHAEKLEFVPLKKLLSVMNYHADAFLRARSDWGNDFQNINLNWNLYFTRSYQEITELAAFGTDTAEMMKEFEAEMLRHETKIGNSLSNIKSNRTNSIKSFIKGKLKSSMLGKAALRMKYKDIAVIKREDYKYGNIFECSKIIDEKFLDDIAKK